MGAAILRYEQLWAPWRLGYIKGQRPASDSLPYVKLPEGADPDCFLCRAGAGTADRENLVVARGEHTLVILNRFPYNNGHLLVASRRHCGRLEQLSDAVHLEAARTIARMVQVLEQSMNADGFNVGLNLGRVAGAGVPGHLHWHVVPRWAGDTNFMPVLGSVNVIPQSLDALWELLTEALAGTGSEASP